MKPLTPIDVEQVNPGSAQANAILWQYYREVVARYHDRETSDDEIDEAMADEPSDDLVAPTGLFVVVRRGSRAVGCGGIRFVDARVGELTRVFVAPPERGTGVAVALVRHLEDRARAAGLARLRLDTRADLVEARGLYAKLGYEEVEAFNDGPYADHWFSKAL
ncbi:GNAT family N-acetyltransferase [Sanguibacter sp. 25GB23B1]|uniref:GNAT family N-acetyltransferase n=1 Tax=unclassified Sanguibacter TaxID=2645534 RepID=UPI0032AE9ECE